MSGRIIRGREPPRVVIDVGLLGVVWLAVAVACLATEPQLGPSPVLGDLAQPVRSYEISEKYDVATGVRPPVPARPSGRVNPWSETPRSLEGSGILAREMFDDLPAGRPLLASQLSSYGSPLRAASLTELTAAESEAVYSGEEPWTLQILPDGLIYRSYLAGAKESRIGCTIAHEHELGWIWDISLGGRVGILRWGTEDPDRPQGWQIDLEGAGLPRLDFENHRDLTAVDFRFGVPVTYGRGRYQTKVAYYHLSSHLGDEYMVRHATLTRKNYARDVIVWGHSFFLTDDIRLYAEAGWAFFALDGSEPWEFQFGVDYSPVCPACTHGGPFFAINGHLREEADFGGNVVVQTGWQWRGNSGHLFRLGMQYYNGMSDQFEFYDQYEDKLGFGLWYDF